LVGRVPATPKSVAMALRTMNLSVDIDFIWIWVSRLPIAAWVMGLFRPIGRLHGGPVDDEK
jgi:hypothetical protein